MCIQVMYIQIYVSTYYMYSHRRAMLGLLVPPLRHLSAIA